MQIVNLIDKDETPQDSVWYVTLL